MLALLPAAFYLSGTRWGTSGIAAMWITVYPVLLLPMFVRVFRSVAIHLRDYVTAVGPTLLSAACMALVVMAVRVVMPDSASLAVRFAAEVAAGGVTFI